MKLLAFIKQNKAIVLALVIVLLSFGLLALPGQFAHYWPDIYAGGKQTYKYYMSGYQWIFNLEVVPKGLTDGVKIGKSAVPHGIAAIVLLGLCVPGLLFSKKSSFVAMLTSLALIVAAILFFTVASYGPKFYEFSQPDKGSRISWVPYVIGGLTILAGAAMTYRTVIVMKNEIKSPSQSKGKSYSYLKNK